MGLMTRKYTQERRDYIARWKLKKLYGMTIEQFQTLYTAQGGACAVCRKPGTLCVDHDHGTGEIRQLLCRGCNGAIGLACDNPEILRALAAYLERTSCSPTRRLQSPSSARPPVSQDNDSDAVCQEASK